MRRIPNFSSYSVTKSGLVWSHRLRKRFIRPMLDPNGYVRYNLIDDTGKRHGIYAHQAVALTYIPNPDDKPEVNHFDHDKTNNNLENLAWVTHQENIQYDWDKGKRQPTYGNTRLTEVIAKQIKSSYETGMTQIALADKFNVSQSTVSNIVNGYVWRDI